MNYYLIANNESITDITIENLKIKKDDVIILFNKQMPLKWNIIKIHKNKYLFLREFENGFHGQDDLIDFNNLYKKLFFISDEYKFKNLKKIDLLLNNNKISKDVIFVLSDIDINYKNYSNFRGKIPQTGLLAYIYIKYNFIYDNIYLIGFTNEYKKKQIWKGHSKEIEQNFYLNELILNKKLIKIDY